MGSISVPAALAISAGAGLAGSAISAGAAGSAAQTQAGATTTAANAQLAMYQQAMGYEQPYLNLGRGAAQALSTMTGTNAAVPSWQPGVQQLLGASGTSNQVLLNGTIYSVPQSLGPNWQPGSAGVSVVQSGIPQSGINAGNPATAQLTAPFQPTMAQLQQTPGYQFTMTQGEQAVQNAFAAQGLGASGAELKGAANYAEGLASTTYQQQFQNYWTQNQNIYNMLSGLTGQGEAAAGTGVAAGGAAQTAANQFATSGAAASAAGQVGTANALTSGISGLSSTALLYALGGQSGMFGPPGGASAYGGNAPLG